MSKTLTKEETLYYLTAWREFEDRQALNELVTKNKGLVWHFALKYYKYINNQSVFEELKMAGYEGLVYAINKFNYKEMPIDAFSTYVSVAIKHQIRFELEKYSKHSHVISFNERIETIDSDDRMKLEDIIGTDAEETTNSAIKNIERNEVRSLLNNLTPKERQIILLKYENENTLEEIAEVCGCTRQNISKIEQRVLKKMRNEISRKQKIINN